MYTAPGRPRRYPCCHTVAIPSSLFPKRPPLSNPDRPRPRSPNCSIYTGIAPFVALILLTRLSPLLYRFQGVKRISVIHNDNPGTGDFGTSLSFWRSAARYCNERKACGSSASESTTISGRIGEVSLSFLVAAPVNTSAVLMPLSIPMLISVTRLSPTMSIS